MHRAKKEYHSDAVAYTFIAFGFGGMLGIVCYLAYQSILIWAKYMGCAS